MGIYMYIYDCLLLAIHDFHDPHLSSQYKGTYEFYDWLVQDMLKERLLLLVVYEYVNPPPQKKNYNNKDINKNA